MHTERERPALIGETAAIRHAVREFKDWIRDERLDDVRPRVHDKMVWLTQTSLAALFGCTCTNVAAHLKRVFAQGDLVEDIATRRMVARASDGKRYTPRYYNLDVAVSLSYRICTEPSARFLVKTTDVLARCTYGAPGKEGVVAARNARVAPDTAFESAYFAEKRAEHEAVRRMDASFTERIRALYESACDFTPTEEPPPESFRDADELVCAESLDEIVGYYVHYATTLDALGVLVSVEDWRCVMAPLARHRAADLAECPVKVVHDVGKAFLEREYAHFRELHGRTFATEFDEFMTLLLAQERARDMLWLC
jgi:hypothetical protein